MATVQEAPPAARRPAPRNRRRIPIALLVVLGCLGLGGGGLYLARYQPLAEGSSSWGGPDSMHAPNFGPGYVLSYQDGRQTMFAFTLLNRGRVGVTVTGVVPDDPDFRALLQVTGARLGNDPERAIDQPGTSEPFHSFGLGSGHERWIFVMGRFAHCNGWGPQTSDILGAVGIRYRVLGIPKTEWVRLSQSLRMDSPPNSGCPERTPSTP